LSHNSNHSKKIIYFPPNFSLPKKNKRKNQVKTDKHKSKKKQKTSNNLPKKSKYTRIERKKKRKPNTEKMKENV